MRSITVEFRCLCLLALIGCVDPKAGRRQDAACPPEGCAADAGTEDAGDDAAGLDAAADLATADLGVVGSDGPASDQAADAPADMVALPADTGPPPADTAVTDVPPSLRQNGEACTGASQCLSKFCVDGVCCNSACAGQCQTCNGPGTLGVCLPVSGDPQGGRSPCGGAGGTCGGVCNGTVGTACTYPGPAVACGAPSCANGVAQPTPTCNGQGACTMPAAVTCAPYPCAGNVCAGGCSDSNPCSGNNYCQAGKCVPRLARGAACSRADQCVDGQCADGVCCDRACAGACEACNLGGSTGTCTYQSGIVCRDSHGDCDPAELCPGNASDCPADKLSSSSVICRGPQGQCDLPESCTGTSMSCPPPGPILACDAGAPPADTAPPPADTAPPDAGPPCPSDVTEVSWDPNTYPGGQGISPTIIMPVWNGGGYTLTWPSESTGSTYEIFVNRLNTSGVEVAGTRKIASPNSGISAGNSVIASSGTGYAVAYTRGLSPTQVYFRPLDSNLAPAANELMVSEGSDAGYNPNVAAGPGEWAVLWNNPGANGAYRAYFRRINAAGAALGSGIQVGAATASITRSGGQVFFWNAAISRYVAGWQESAGSVIAFISQDGLTVTKGMAAAGTSARDLSIAFRAGVGYGITYGEFPGSPDTWTVSFARTDLSGNAIAGSKITLNTPGTIPASAGVVWTGTDWLVMWAEGPTGTTATAIWTARIDAAGTLEPGSRRPITCAGARDLFPFLVWGGGKAAVTFLRNDSDGRILIF
jgi:hypothetical protein